VQLDEILTKTLNIYIMYFKIFQMK